MTALRAVGRFVLLTAVVVTVGQVGARAISRTERDIEAGQRADRIGAARAAAVSLDEWFAGASTRLDATGAALQPWVGGVDQRARARPVLDRFSEAGPFDVGMMVVDLNGRVAATTAGLAVVVGQVRSGSYLDATRTGARAVSDVTDDALLRLQHLSVAVPLRNARGTVTGALVGLTRVPEGTLAQLVVRLAGAVGGRLCLVTPGGTVLDARPVAGTIRRLDEESAAPVAAIASDPGRRQAGLLVHEGEAGQQLATAYAPVGEAMTVVVPADANSLHAGATRGSRTATAWLVGVLAAALVALTLVDLRHRARARAIEDAKRSFLAIVGHELRTPLTVVKGFTDMLGRRGDALTGAARQEVIDTIGLQVRNLEHLIERMLVAAEIDAGSTPQLADDVVDGRALLESAASFHGRLSPTHDVRVDAEGPLAIRGDQRSLDLIVDNLVENAIKYSPSGGSVVLSGRRRSGWVDLVVEDEGVGLPADTLNLFERFVQRESVDARVHDEGGVGLGLYIVASLVSRLGGSVRAERRPERGARFVVTLRAANND